tara:strand:- start:141 stop:296 length:156 start_codon:yes stop_codon:yes gene_type:complete
VKSFLFSEKEIDLVKRSVSKFWTYAVEKKDVELCDQLELLSKKLYKKNERT